MAGKREGFFGTENIHRAGWTALMGIVGFIGALGYQKLFGPQRVVIDTTNSRFQPTVVAGATSPTRLTEDDLADIAKIIESIRNTANSKPETQQLESLALEVKRLQDQLSQRIQSPLVQGSNRFNQKRKATGVVESFALPSSVKGYTNSALIGVKNSTCTPEVVKRGGNLVATFHLVDKDLVKKASPLLVTVVQERSPTDYLQITQLPQALQPDENIITINPDLAAGKYRLIYGFYLRNQLATEYPNFYSKECQFVVI